MGYSIQIKEAVLQKVLSGNKPHHEISQEFGVGRSTIGKWLRQYKKDGNINLKSKAKRPKDWTSEQRISALIETGSMTSEDCVAWCRKKGYSRTTWSNGGKMPFAVCRTLPINSRLKKKNNIKKRFLL